MRYLSVCSGIEAATAAWHDLGFEPVAFSEIEPFPSAVLAHHYPNVPNWGDMTRYKEWPNAQIDILVGGTPCQSFSVAGLRKGLDDPRGSLMLTFLGIAERYRPRYIVWENVPGVLSSNGGRDFGSFLGALGNLGYGWAYRVLDAQWFGVAQRRRRVFVVASLGDQRRAAQVLFEREGVCRDPAPSRAPGQRPAPSLAPRTRGGGTDTELDGGLIPETANAITASMANSCLNHNKDENVLAIDAYNQSLTGAVSKTVASRDDQDTASLVARDWPAEIAPTLNAAFGEKQGLEDQHALGGAGLFVPAVVGDLTAKGPSGLGVPEVDAHHYVMSSGQANASITRGKTGALDCPHEAPIVAHAPRAEDDTPPVPVAFHPTQDPISSTGTTHAMGTGSKGGMATVAVAWSIMPQNSGRDYKARSVDVLQPLMATGPQPSTNQGGDIIQQAMQVRRLTPRECERLQGFPDNFTAIPWRGRAAIDCPDGPRYKALGNSMAVPCMRWIGTRIKE